MKLVTLLAKVNDEKCIGCQTCTKVCPTTAINIENSRKANFNPEQILCYCTETRAQEVAAAILKGANTGS